MISNISLEFDTVTNAFLASQIGTEDMKAAFYMIEFLDLVLFHSRILIQVIRWTLRVPRRVLRVCYSYLQKKEPPLNLNEILKNVKIPEDNKDNKG